MNLIEAVLLGCLQGLTEFLPVSSSAHLVAAQRILGIEQRGIALEVCVHLGTLLAIMIVLARPITRVARDGALGLGALLRGRPMEIVRAEAPLFNTAVAVIIGTIPIALAGVLFQSAVEDAFANLTMAGGLLMVTGLALLTLRLAPEGRAARVGPGRGLLVGLAQALALLPGISRSGSAIVAARFLGIERGAAAEFSFILAVPAIAGAGVWELRGSWGALAGQSGAGAGVLPLAAAGAAAAVVGAVCLRLLLDVVRRGRLHWFAFYCLPAGASMLALGLLRG